MSIIARNARLHRLRMALSPTTARCTSIRSIYSTRSQLVRRRIGIVVSSGLLLTLGVGLSPYCFSPLHADTTAAYQEQHLARFAADDATKPSLAALIRSYLVYTMCSIPILVDNSPRILKVLTSIPGVKQVTEALVRITFFEQFVGGDTVQDTLPLLHTLRSSNQGALFAYTVEVEPEVTSKPSASSSISPLHANVPAHEKIVDEIIHCIDVAATYEDRIAGARTTWVAVKIATVIADPRALINLSSHIIATRASRAPSLSSIAFPGCPHPTDLDVLDLNSGFKGVGQDKYSLTAHDIECFRELHANLVRICTRAQERGVKVVIDAEYSWYSPAIDALTLSLMRRFNKLPVGGGQTHSVQPLVYGTYQAYLRRTPAHIAQSLVDAKTNGYALGVKLVRGAYHPHEIAAHEAASVHGKSLSISPDSYPPVWSKKSDTDACFNECAKVLVKAIKDDVSEGLEPRKTRPPAIGVLFGTHNWASCDLILAELVNCGLGVKEPGQPGIVRLGEDVTKRLTMGQLYGMSDALTNHLVSKTRTSSPFVVKYIPYGALSEVMPYLGRRAIENTSVLGDGAAADERRWAGAEIWRRLFG